MKSSLLIVALLAVIYSCSKKTTPTASAKVETAASVDSTVIADMTVNESTFRQVCSSCHDLPSPLKHTASEWPKVVDKMQSKKPFTASQKAQISAFLVANARM